MHASSADDPSPPDILKQIGCIVLESRIPSSHEEGRGYVEGPHYPNLFLGTRQERSAHICMPQDNRQCHLVQQLERLTVDCPTASVDFSIHVYLTPPPCNQKDCDAHLRKRGWMLIENWSFRTLQNSQHQAFAITSLTLLHALRSFLHFTQLSSWLSRLKGKWNHGVEIVITSDRAEWRPEHASNLIIHKFVDCKIGNAILSVCASLLPKLEKIPSIACPDCSLGNESPTASPRSRLLPRSGLTTSQLVTKDDQAQTRHISGPFRSRSFYLEQIRATLLTDDDYTTQSAVKPTAPLSPAVHMSPIEDGILINTSGSTNSTPHVYKRLHESTPIDIPGSSQNRGDIERRNTLNLVECAAERRRWIEACVSGTIVPESLDEQSELELFIQAGEEGLDHVPSRGRDRTPRKRQASERSANSRDRRWQVEGESRIQKTSRKLDLEKEEAPSVLTVLRHRTDILRTQLAEAGPSRIDFTTQTGNPSRTTSSPSRCNTFEVYTDTPSIAVDKVGPKNSENKGAKDDDDVTNFPSLCDKSRIIHRNVPSAQDRAKFRKYLDSSACMVFHTKNVLPLTSSPAPIPRGDSFDFDKSIDSVKAIKNALFVEDLPVPLSPVETATSPVPYERFRGLQWRRSLRKGSFPSVSSSSLLGSFEESMLNGRLDPTSTVEGFRADLGASGLFCPPHRKVPVSVFFYTLNSEMEGLSPYLGHINLGEKGYQVPREGTIQLTLFNPQGTVIKMFVVLYNLSEMPSNSKTFLRQRTYYMPSSSGEHHPNVNRWLRYLVHLRFASTKSGRIFLHTDIRLIVIRKSDADTAFGHELEKRYEWKSFTRGPTNPRFSPCL